MLLSARSNMESAESESVEYECGRLGGLAHVNVQYSNGRGRSLLAEFHCDQAADCGIRRSPFSGSLNYTVDCPLYVAWKII
jgi:hypothetical protein